MNYLIQNKKRRGLKPPFGSPGHAKHERRAQVLCFSRLFNDNEKGCGVCPAWAGEASLKVQSVRRVTRGPAPDHLIFLFSRPKTMKMIWRESFQLTSPCLQSERQQRMQAPKFFYKEYCLMEKGMSYHAFIINHLGAMMFLSIT